MKEVPLSAVKDDLSRYLRAAENEDVVITRHGRPAGVLIGFRSEDDWFDFRLENDPRFLARVLRARQELRAGEGVRMEDLEHSLFSTRARASGGRRRKRATHLRRRPRE